MASYLSRGIELRLQARLQRDPLVILEGARATGKTRLVQHAVEEGWLREVRSFLDPALRAAAEAAPRDFVRQLPHGTAIDEAQLCPGIMLPLKERVETTSPGSILLTGSTRLHRDELGGSDPFAGRVGRTLQLAPLTIGEQVGRPVDLVSHLFLGEPSLIDVERPFTRSEIVSRLDQPGLPGLVALPDPAERRERSQEYLRQVLSRSPFDSLDIQRVTRLARHVAARTSTLLNVQQFGQASELSRETVNKYLARLEEALVIVALRGWRRSKDKSETDKSKVHFFDAGVAAGVGLMRPTEAEQDLGRLTETLVVTDLVRQCEWQLHPPMPFHWRRNNRDEVDLVLENADGRVICIEVKTAEQVGLADFRGIDAFQQAHAEVFHRGFVFYTGSQVLPFGQDRWAIPIASLRPAPVMEVDPVAALVAAARSDGREEMDDQEPLRREVVDRLEALGRSLEGYEHKLAEPTGRIQLNVRRRASNKTHWILVEVWFDGDRIRARVPNTGGLSGVVHAEDIGSRAPGEVALALLQKAAPRIGQAMVRADKRQSG